MADKDIIRKGATAVEVYRSNDAAPDSWENAKFWLTNELRRIQTGFFSVDELLETIQNQITDIGGSGGSEDGSTGAQGPPGPQGPAGEQGPEGPQGPAGDTSEPDLSQIFQDGVISNGYGWTSQKINDELRRLETEIDDTDTSLKWIDYATGFSSIPTLLGTSVNGPIYQYDYAFGTRYREIGTTDGFYLTYEAGGPSVDGLLAKKELDAAGVRQSRRP